MFSTCHAHNQNSVRNWRASFLCCLKFGAMNGYGLKLWEINEYNECIKCRVCALLLSER